MRKICQLSATVYYLVDGGLVAKCALLSFVFNILDVSFLSVQTLTETRSQMAVLHVLNVKGRGNSQSVAFENKNIKICALMYRQKQYDTIAI